MHHSSQHRLLPFKTFSINNSDNSFFFLSIFYRLSKSPTLVYNKQHRVNAKAIIGNIGTISSIRSKNVITRNVYILIIQTIHRLTANKLTNSTFNNIPTVIWTHQLETRCYHKQDYIKKEKCVTVDGSTN